MARVYRAYDHDREQWCAIKLLRQRHARDPKSRHRFLDEARTMTALHHRNVIATWDVVADAAQPFMVMELAEGGSLMDWTREHGLMPARTAVDLTIQICKGIGAAHKMGVIHRDIKPHNILLNHRGVCKVADFGIAQLPREDGTTDVPDAGVVGTLGYMAPEQRTDRHMADPRTDVYGIGATLYTLLTARTVMNLFIAEREPELLEGLPPVLIPILTKATNYQVSARYSNVQELAKALYDARVELPTSPDFTLVDPLPEPPKPPPRPAPYPPPELGTITLSEEGGRKPATTPPPAALRTATPAPAAPRSAPSPTTSPTIKWAGLAALALLLIASLIPLTGTFMVRSSHTYAMDQRTSLFQALDRELSIVDELAALGADRHNLEQQYRDQRAVTDPQERLFAARRYIETLQREVRQRAQQPSIDAVAARERLDRIQASQAAYAQATSAWEHNTRSFPGSVAVKLGLNPTP